MMERVFICLECDEVIVAKDDKMTCSKDHDMEDSGWFESND